MDLFNAIGPAVRSLHIWGTGWAMCRWGIESARTFTKGSCGRGVYVCVKKSKKLNPL